MLKCGIFWEFKKNLVASLNYKSLNGVGSTFSACTTKSIIKWKNLLGFCFMMRENLTLSQLRQTWWHWKLGYGGCFAPPFIWKNVVIVEKVESKFKANKFITWIFFFTWSLLLQQKLSIQSYICRWRDFWVSWSSAASVTSHPLFGGLWREVAHVDLLLEQNRARTAEQPSRFLE